MSRDSKEQAFWYSLAQTSSRFGFPNFLSPLHRLSWLNWAGVWREKGKKRGGGEAAGTGGQGMVMGAVSLGDMPDQCWSQKQDWLGLCVSEPLRTHAHPHVRARGHTHTCMPTHTKAYAGWSVPAHLSRRPSTNMPQCQSSYKLWCKLLTVYEDEEKKFAVLHLEISFLKKLSLFCFIAATDKDSTF